MTSQQRQPPRRSLAAANPLQPPLSHRSLAQQYQLSSPAARRSGDNFVDLTLEDSEAIQGRYGTLPRHGSSHLKLGLAQDLRSLVLVESPKPASERDASTGDADAAGSDARALTDAANTPDSRNFTRGALDGRAASDALRAGRVYPIHRGPPLLRFDLPKPGVPSPMTTEDVPKDTAPRPLPLPARPGRHAPPPKDTTRQPSSNPVKKDGRPKPYSLTAPPIAPVYANSGTFLQITRGTFRILTNERRGRFLSLDGKSPRRSILRYHHPPGLPREDPYHSE